MKGKKHSFFGDLIKDEFYIVKQRQGHEDLTPEMAVADHISNAIYRLFGIETPDFYIGEYKQQLSLFSRFLSDGYLDLKEWLGGQEALDEINRHNNLVDCVDTYKKFEAPLSIIGKERLLASAIILEDTDVIGAGFSNIGLIKVNKQHKIIKIDPSHGIFNTPPTLAPKLINDFGSELSNNNPLLYKTFSYDLLVNNPKSILGNLHLCEFFHDIDKTKLNQRLLEFTSLSDDHIKELVIRPEYLEVLNSDDAHDYLTNIANILIAKKNVLAKYLNLVTIEVQPPVLPDVFATNLELGETVEVMKHGASKPLKVKRINANNECKLEYEKSPIAPTA
jgi:hypothetical protein